MRITMTVACVGLCCFDLMLTCDDYPKEDSDQRVKSMSKLRGGNASNNATVLSLLGVKAEFMGVFSSSNSDDLYLRADFAEHEIGTEYSYSVHGCGTPTSVVIINSRNGSRTILHSRNDLPEYDYNTFKTLDFSRLSWIHFEGRSNVDEMVEMLSLLGDISGDGSKIYTSAELEKAKADIAKLMPLADVVFVSKDYANFCGYTSMQETVRKLLCKVRENAVLVCPWGEEGAAAQRHCSDACMVTSPCFPPPDGLVDTLGAGDTFVGAFIALMSRLMMNGTYVSDLQLAGTVEWACKVAGAKCGAVGFSAVHGWKDELEKLCYATIRT